MTDTPMLRDKQIEQLSFYIANPKCLDLSDPGTGKTPPCCVYAYWNWARQNKKTIWPQPKSLLKKNLREMLRFTDFKNTDPTGNTVDLDNDDVVILTTDHLPMTKSWTGPTLQRTKTVRSWPVTVKLTGEVTDTYTLRKRAGKAVGFFYAVEGTWVQLNGTKRVEGGPCPGLEVLPTFGPDGVTPKRADFAEHEVVRDMIAAAKNAKVFICTFAFMSEHWQRLIDTVPELDLLLVDELHMPGGYSTPGTKATESFFWMNKHCSRFVGMTGTLINGRLDSAYPAISVIEPRYYGSLQGFYHQHAAVVDDYDRVILWKNEEHLKKIIQRHSIARTFAEVYGEEDVAFFTEFVDIAEGLRGEYDKFHEQAMLELESGEMLDGTLPGVALIRARQIMAHPETMGLAKGEQTGKDERLETHLREGKKCLVFASLKPEQRRILELCRSLGLRAELINSDTSGARRAAIDEMAQRGELDVIVGSGPTVAVGYNWEMFDHVIFVSIDYLDTNILQAYRRADRGGRTSTLRVTFLQYRDSIDQRMYQINKVKSQLANRVDPNRRIIEFAEAA